MPADDNAPTPAADNGPFRPPLATLNAAEILPAPPVEGVGAGSVDPADIAGAFAANTRRVYATHWRLWTGWCAERGHGPLPADPAAVAEHLKGRVSAGNKVATVRVALAGIVQVHRLAGAPFDKAAPALAFAMKALARQHGTAAQGKRELLTPEIEAMLAALGSNGEKNAPGFALRTLRDRALILLGFAGAFRRSELAALDVADLDFRRDGVVAIVRRSKGDQEGRGQPVAIRYGQREKTCPVRALKAWLKESGIAEGPVFRLIIQQRLTDKRISGKVVWRLVKAAAARVGIDPNLIGAHSLRIGHVTQALANGADPLGVRDQARHKKLDTTLGYNRRGEALKGSTSGKLGL